MLNLSFSLSLSFSFSQTGREKSSIFETFDCFQTCRSKNRAIFFYIPEKKLRIQLTIGPERLEEKNHRFLNVLFQKSRDVVLYPRNSKLRFPYGGYKLIPLKLFTNRLTIGRQRRLEEKNHSISKRSVPKIAPSCFTSPKKKNYFNNRIRETGREESSIFKHSIPPNHTILFYIRATKEKITFSIWRSHAINDRTTEKNHRYSRSLNVPFQKSHHLVSHPRKKITFTIGSGREESCYSKNRTILFHIRGRQPNEKKLPEQGTTILIPA